MKLLWASPRAHIGAVELALIEGVRELRLRGHDQHVIVPGHGPIVEVLNDLATVHVIAHNPWIRRDLPTTGRWLAYNALVAYRRLESLIRRIAPDAVISETVLFPTPAFAARSAGVPHVWHVHGLPTPAHPAVEFTFGRRVTMRAIGYLGDRVLCVSDSVRRDIARWVPPDRLELVDWAATVPSMSASSRSRRPYRAILLGYKSPGKGQHEALRALAILCRRGIGVELELVGGGVPDYVAYLKRLSVTFRLTEHVRFVDHRDDALALLANSDVALMCSRHDAFPRVTIEAMKLGTPVVAAADYGLMEQVVHERTGLLYRPGDAVDLADCVQRLLGDPDLAKTLSDCAHEWASRRFTSQRYGDLLEDALRSVISAA